MRYPIGMIAVESAAPMLLGRELLLDWLERGGHGASRGLARVMGISEVTVSYWAHGVRRPTLTQAVKLQEAAGVPVESWVQEVKTP